MRRFALFLLLFIACHPTRPPAEARPAVAEVAPLWSRAAVEADVAVLRQAFEALHPGLHRYISDARLGAAYDSLTQELLLARDVGDGFLALTRFTALIRCGHTFPNPANQSEEVTGFLARQRRVPLLFRWLAGKAVVLRSLRGETLPPGTIIESFDGHSAGEVAGRLLELARSDGGNDAKRLATLDVLGLEDDEAFDLYYPLLFELGETLRLDVVLPDGSHGSLELPTMTAAERRAALGPSVDVAEPSAAWSLRPLDPSTMYVAMPTWVMYRGKRDWKADVRSMFESLARSKATTLVIDLRGNEGGDDVGSEILRYLIARPLALESLERRVRYRSVPDALRPVLDTWDRSFFDWGDDAEPIVPGWYRLRGESSDETLTPSNPRFAGRVLVLVDAANSSATFQFAQHAQRHRLATLIGAPTGGNQRGINGGAFFFLRLPNLGLEVDLPLIGRFPRDGDLEALPDAGIVPDVEVPLTAADVAAGRDPVLEKATAREVARYTVDGAGNVIEVRVMWGQPVRFTYDGRRLASELDDEGKPHLTYHYDDRARIRTIETSGGPGVTHFVYDDATNRLTRLNHEFPYEPPDVTSFEYDDRGRPIRVTQSLDGHTTVSSYRYECPPR